MENILTDILHSLLITVIGLLLVQMPALLFYHVSKCVRERRGRC